MGEKFSWDRLMKRGKGADEDNTINLVPERVEGPVAPLKSSAVPPQQQYKAASPDVPPVVHGSAPPMNANRAPLVIDWEEFSKEEATTNSVAPIEVTEPPVAPVQDLEPIQVPPQETSEPTAKSGNFWDQLNKQTQAAMGNATEAATAPETPVESVQAPISPVAPKPVVTGWDDVEMTPREKTPATPTESDIMAGTLDPNAFRPITAYERPTEEEIKQKTEAIAQSNAWGEPISTPIAPAPPVNIDPPVAEPIVPPVFEEVAKPTEDTSKSGSNDIHTIDVGESPFMSKPPSSHYEVEDPFKPTGNKLLGTDRPSLESLDKAPEQPQATAWDPAEEFAAPTAFEKSDIADAVASDESTFVESFGSNDAVDFGNSVVPTQEFVAPSAFEVSEPKIEKKPSFDQSPEVHSGGSEDTINSRVEEMLGAFDAPSTEAQAVPAEITAEVPAEFDNIASEAPSYTSEEAVEGDSEPIAENEVEDFAETVEPISFDSNLVAEDVAHTPTEPARFETSLTSEEATQTPVEPVSFESSVVAEEDSDASVEPVVEATQATPADFWANIPGAQTTPATDSLETAEVFEQVANETVAHETPEIDADLERDIRTGDLLLKHKLVAPAQLERALARQRDTKEKLGQVLVSMGLISERRLLQVLASQKGVSPWHLEDDAPSQDAMHLVSHETCQLFQVLPVAVRGDMLLLAMRETQDLEAIEAIRTACGKRIEPVLADEVRLAYTIDEAYGVARERGESAVEQMVAIAHEQEVNLSDGTIVNPERPDHLTALLRELITDAKRKSATSITIGHGDGEGEILYRIHGRLCPVQTVPIDLAASVLKTASADLEEQRIPFEIGSDYKVTITTGQQGDNFVVTFPQAEAKLTSLDELSIEEENLKLLRELTQRPYGLFLITGAVRSSKQATLKALSQEMEREGRVVARASVGENIAEQINLAVTSESEVIVVGELENEGDIRAAVKAASSGHLILAEVTANDAPTAIQQLISCGADPYLLATILTGVWSQALAPRLCLNCREAQNLTDAERSLLDHYGMRHIQKVFESQGCESCNHTGVSGQIVLSEVLPVSSDVSHLIANKAPVEEMAEQSGFAGYLPMDFDAMTRVIHGDVDFATARRLVLFSLRELSAICRRDTWETQAS